MNENYEITPLSSDFDFSKVPGWYTFCFNSACPLHEQCMRFFAGTYVPKKQDSGCHYGTLVFPSF